MKLRKYALLAAFCAIAGCQQAPEDVVFEPGTPVVNVQPYQESTIALQDLRSRVLVYCYSSENTTAAQCAQIFEQKGYVRLRDIPRLPAEHDFLKADTYPTRRWRRQDLVPRW